MPTSPEESVRKLVVAGSNGFLGQAVCAHFRGGGWKVVELVRRPSREGQVAWDGKTLGAWAAELEGADAVVNFAGRTVNCRYTAKNREEILNSRVESTRALGAAIACAKVPPKVWLNSSTATIYRDSRNENMDEFSGEAGSGFSVSVAKAWEAEVDGAVTPRTRKVKLQISFILGPTAGTAFAVFYKMVMLRAGGTLGPGDQYVSWMHVDDCTRAIEFLIEHPELDGPFILASPEPEPMRVFMADFRRAAGVSIGLPAYTWMLEVGAFFMRTETELLLKSRRVFPRRLLDAGFEFEHPRLGEALVDLVRQYRAVD
jgi:uncharacterized protein (TIGR01777 family)